LRLENKSKDNKEKKYFFFFFFKSAGIVAGVGRPLAVDGGWQWQLVAGDGWRWLLSPKD
jgi:hypothetical protein